MKNDRLIDLGLTGYEELFMSTEERLDAKKPKVETIPLADLTPFRNHPFKVKEDEEMAQLMRSIADAGVLSPAPVSYTHLDVYKRQWQDCRRTYTEKPKATATRQSFP